VAIEKTLFTSKAEKTGGEEAVFMFFWKILSPSPLCGGGGEKNFCVGPNPLSAALLILLVDAHTVNVADDRWKRYVISSEWCGAG